MEGVAAYKDSPLCSPYPPNRRPIHPTDALSTQPMPYPPDRRPIHPTDALSTQLTPYPGDIRREWLHTRTAHCLLHTQPRNRIQTTSKPNNQVIYGGIGCIQGQPTVFGDVQWFRGGLVFEAHRLLYHSA